MSSIVYNLTGKYAKKFRVREYSEDLFQVASQAYIEALATFDPEKGLPLSEWQILMVKNRLVNYIQRDILKHKNAIININALAKINMEGISIKDIINVFNPLEKTILYLAVIDLMSYKDIGKQLGISVYKVKNVVRNIKKYFKEEYQ